MGSKDGLRVTLRRPSSASLHIIELKYPATVSHSQDSPPPKSRQLLSAGAFWSASCAAAATKISSHCPPGGTDERLWSRGWVTGFGEGCRVLGIGIWCESKSSFGLRIGLGLGRGSRDRRMAIPITGLHFTSNLDSLISLSRPQLLVASAS